MGEMEIMQTECRGKLVLLYRDASCFRFSQGKDTINSWKLGDGFPISVDKEGDFVYSFWRN